MTELRPITLDEVVTKIPRGERNFSNTVLENADLSGHERYTDLQSYLMGLSDDNLQQKPVIIVGSGWKYLKAEELYLPFLRAMGADLSGAVLSRAVLSRADLREARLYGARLYRVDLSGAVLNRAVLNRAVLSGARLYRVDLREADLSEAVLSGADLRGARLYGARLYRVDLREADLSEAVLKGAFNLEYACGISDAIYIGTIISPWQERILRNAFEKAGKTVEKHYFVVR